MDSGATVRVYNETIGIKGGQGRLIRINPQGFYEISLEIQGKFYSSFLPVSGTAIISLEPETETVERIEIER
jgi:hypothetical protein